MNGLNDYYSDSEKSLRQAQGERFELISASLGRSTVLRPAGAVQPHYRTSYGFL